jgi:hypothetical protein
MQFLFGNEILNYSPPVVSDMKEEGSVAYTLNIYYTYLAFL